MWLRAASATDLLSLSRGPSYAPRASAQHVERESLFASPRPRNGFRFVICDRILICAIAQLLKDAKFKKLFLVFEGGE